MTRARRALPEPFADLEPLVAHWAVDGSDARMNLRLESSESERTAFYDAIIERLPAALDYLDQRSLSRLNGPERNLMNLTLSLAHIGMAIERFGDQEAEHAIGHRHIRIVVSTAGIAADPA